MHRAKLFYEYSLSVREFCNSCYLPLSLSFSLSLSLCLSRAHSQYSIIQLLFSSSGKPISQVRRRRLGTYLTRRRQSLPTIRRSVTSSLPKTACCFPEFSFPCLFLSFFFFFSPLLFFFSFLHFSFADTVTVPTLSIRIASLF